MLTLRNPTDCSPPGSSVHGILQARIVEQGSHSLLRWIFLTQGLNQRLLHWQAGSLPLTPPGKPRHLLYFIPTHLYNPIRRKLRVFAFVFVFLFVDTGASRAEGICWTCAGKWQSWESNSSPPYSKAHIPDLHALLPLAVPALGYAVFRIECVLCMKILILRRTHPSVPMLLACSTCCYPGSSLVYFRVCALTFSVSTWKPSLRPSPLLWSVRA